MRIETDTRIEIMHKKYGKFFAIANSPFNSKDAEWDIKLAQDELKTKKKTYFRNAQIKCKLSDIINYFLV